MCSNCHLSIHLRIQSLSIHHPPIHHPPTHLPTCVSICSSNYPLIPLFIQPSTELQLTHPFPINQSPIHPLSYPPIHLPTHPSTPPLPTHSPLLAYPSIHESVYIHVLTPDSSILSPMHPSCQSRKYLALLVHAGCYSGAEDSAVNKANV